MFIQAQLRSPPVPRFIAISYGDQNGYDRTAPEIRDAARANDAKLKQGGALMGSAGEAVQVRNPDATGVQIANMAFMSSPLPIAGFTVIEAATLKDAIALVSKSPGAVMHGVIEIWPLKES
jgi:hypothetical protein